MKILVCVRQNLDGDISPFDACAYEAALRIKGAEVMLVSMASEKAKDFLLRLTRLGAKKAFLLSDKAFAGADTLATAYTLSLLVMKIKPDLVFCGRQALVGDTAQTGPMLSVYAGLSLITNVMGIEKIGSEVVCHTRNGGIEKAPLPALLTFERINTLRLPSIISKAGEVEMLDAASLSADLDKCGLRGSPTRVLRTFENESGKRKCKFIEKEELPEVISLSRKKERERIISDFSHDKRLTKVCIIGESPREFAEMISDDITVLPLTDANDIANKIIDIKPNAVLFGSDTLSKKISAQVGAKLKLGLCADCTMLETDGSKLYMYRPALSGSVIAKIESLTAPALATVRTSQDSSDTVMCIGFGAKDSLEKLQSFAKKIGADVSATRKSVDHDLLPYELQVGLTGKTVNPSVYIAVGVSGAVHHIVGMQGSGTVIAINPDKNAPIFDYADYGILCSAEEIAPIL